MATQTIQFRSPPSQTVTLRLFVAGSDTQIASAAATEATNRKGTYTADFADVPAAEYQYIATIGTSPIVPVASGYVTLTLTTATFQTYDAAKAVNLDEVSGGDPAAIAEAVAQYDQRDEEATAGTIGWYFKKLRQASNTVEAVVTNDITPTATTFSVSLTTYPTGAFRHAVLAVVEDGAILDQNSPIDTFTNNGTYSTIVLEEGFTSPPTVGDVMLINVVSHVHSISGIAAGVWGATSAAYSAATGTFGYWVNAISTMIEYVGSVWRWKATSLAEAPTESGFGQYQITLVADSTGGQVPGVVFRIVGTVLNVTTGSNGEAIINLDAGSYTLRTVVPAGYEPVADRSIEIVDEDVAEVIELVATTVTPPTNPAKSALEILCLDETGEPEAEVAVDIRIAVVPSGDQNIAYKGTKQTATSDVNGVARLEAIKGAEYEYKRGKAEVWNRVTIGNGDTTSVSSFIGSP